MASQSLCAEMSSEGGLEIGEGDEGVALDSGDSSSGARSACSSSTSAPCFGEGPGDARRRWRRWRYW